MCRGAERFREGQQTNRPNFSEVGGFVPSYRLPPTAVIQLPDSNQLIEPLAARLTGLTAANSS